MPNQSINLRDPNTTKINALYAICSSLVTAAEAGIDATTADWHSWFYTYLMWHESAGLTKRIQVTDSGNGPGRGLMQFEATTAWDTVKIYVEGPTPGLIARLADAAGVDKDAQIAPALQAFANLDNPNNVWPGGVPENNVENWLLNSDSFGICLMQIQFERFATVLPPLPPATSAASPRDPQYHAQLAQVWADSWWKGSDAEKPARIQQFLSSATALDQALPWP